MKPLGDPLRLPATKLASEHHGSKAGRIWRHKMTSAGLVPVVCKKCKAPFVFGNNNLPHCSSCGVEPKIASRVHVQSEEQMRIERARKAKEWRMYGNK